MIDNSGTEVAIERVAEMNCPQCGTRMDVSALEPFAVVQCPDCGNQDTVPARFGQFLLLNLINTGGMGGVYRARDESLGRLVAIKVMLSKLGEDVEFVENFRREAQAAARLNHPNVAQIYSYGQVRGQPYIVMELVSGHRFDRLIENHPEGLDPALVLRIGIDIADGLHAADEIGLVHGDIKPENILLDEKRKAKLVDFGIASYADQAASEGVWGSPYYIAPERARGRKSDARSDIYSLGATLYHALAGKPPFEGETPIDVIKARLNADAPPLSEVRSDLPRGISDTVVRMLQREPTQRHPTYASLIGDLRRNLQELAATSPSLRVGGTGKRVVIKRKDSAGTHSGKLLVARGPGGRSLLPIPSVEEQTAIEQTRRRRTRRIVGGVFLVVGVVVAAVVVGVQRHGKHQAEIELRRQQHVLRQAIEAASGVFTALDKGATNVVRAAAQLEVLAVRAQAALAVVEVLPGVDAVAVDTNEAAAPVGPVAAVRDAVARVQALTADAQGAVEKAQRTVRSGQQLQAGLADAANLEDVQRKQNALQSEQESLDKLVAGVKASVTEAGPLVERAEVAAAEARVAAERARDEQARQEAESAQQAKADAERQAVEALGTQGRELVRAWRFDEAVALATRASGALETESAKVAAAAVRDRYQRLVGLKAFVVQELSRAPFPWGWGRPGGKREDVIGADEKSVKLRGRQVAWAKVGNPQFLALVDHCLGRPETRRSAQGEQALAAAIFCWENGGDDFARRYREQALQAVPSLERDAERLLPLP
jgi:serine/threonine protein kinase